MKNHSKKILIILGLLLIVVVGGLWLYLLVFMNKDSDKYANLPYEGEAGFEEDSLNNRTNPSIDTSPVNDRGEAQLLRQLTTKPVAGARFVHGGIQYVERGTGHIFDINFATGEEIQSTNTTIPYVTDALLSSQGNVVFITEINNKQEVFVGNISGEGVITNGFTLPEGTANISFSKDGTLLRYTTNKNNETKGYEISSFEEAPRLLFTIPLLDTRVVWNNNTTYINTTPTGKQEGYLYTYQNKRLAYVTNPKVGLIGIPFEGGLITTQSANGNFYSSIIRNGQEVVVLPGMLPEKCVEYTEDVYLSSFYCTIPESQPDAIYPDDWYKGAIRFSDTLWEITPNSNGSSVIANFKTLSGGRELDIYKISISDSGQYLYLINKNDDTLWMFDLWLYNQQNDISPAGDEFVDNTEFEEFPETEFNATGTEALPEETEL